MQYTTQRPESVGASPLHMIGPDPKEMDSQCAEKEPLPIVILTLGERHPSIAYYVFRARRSARNGG